MPNPEAIPPAGNPPTPFETRAAYRDWWWRSTASSGQRRLLDFEQLRDSLARQTDHLRQLFVVERRFFGRGLQFNEASRPGHHQIHIHFRGGILLVTKIQERHARQDSNA